MYSSNLIDQWNIYIECKQWWTCRFRKFGTRTERINIVQVLYLTRQCRHLGTIDERSVDVDDDDEVMVCGCIRGLHKQISKQTHTHKR